ncbi:MAG: hypothetical protein CMF49_03495 [Legionellales bacterium]|nr:hypothetical protein [Legionellales bacterium]
MSKYFPQGIANDEAFCNRENERSAVSACIESHEHLVLIAPRRYGKSSLISQVLKENHFPGTCIDLFFVLSQSEVTKSIAEGVSRIVNEIMPATKAAGKKILQSVATLNPKLTINLLGQRIELSAKQSEEKSISELLLALDEIARKTKKTCVLVLDEFQQIGELKENHAIEAAIRHAVERSTNVSYIFCGSKHHLLNEMFSDKSRPLYHLCDLMMINRISTVSYQNFLNKMAKSKWKQHLNEDALSEIIYLTENHSYYINALCRRLWREKHAPLISEVRKSWNEYVIQQGAWIIDELSRLTLNRRKVLVTLASEKTKEPQGESFCKKARLSASGVKRALNDLIKSDMVLKSQDGYYHILDPAISYFIRNSH